MSVFRVEKTKDYTTMSNYHLRDKRLSLKAKGLLSWMLSNSDDWDYTLAGIVSCCKEGETTVNTALRELQEFGYVEIIKKKPDATNNRIHYDYNVYEKPQDSESLALESQGVESQALENQALINTNKRNTKISNIIDNKEVEWFLKNYHETCVSLPKVMKLSDKRRKAILKILNKFSKDDILDCFDRIEESDFLIGNNDRGWKADIDFILREDKFINILEGKYGGKKKRSTTHDRISESGDLYVEHSNKRKEVAKYGTEKF